MVILVGSIGCSKDEDHKWVLIENNLYYDKNNIFTIDNKNRRIWLKTIKAPPPKDQTSLKDAWDKAEPITNIDKLKDSKPPGKYPYTIDLTEINCSNREMSLIVIMNYDADDNKTGEYRPPSGKTKFDPIIPGSLGSEIHKIACK